MEAMDPNLEELFPNLEAMDPNLEISDPYLETMDPYLDGWMEGEISFIEDLYSLDYDMVDIPNIELSTWNKFLDVLNKWWTEPSYPFDWEQGGYALDYYICEDISAFENIDLEHLDTLNSITEIDIEPLDTLHSMTEICLEHLETFNTSTDKDTVVTIDDLF